VLYLGDCDICKGADTEQEFNLVINGFSLYTFVTNGGIPKVTSVVGNMSIYQVTYQMVRNT
jgi:hypothetical protein